MSYRATSTGADEQASRSSPSRALEFDQVRKAVNDVWHGEVRVIIQDGVIIQIDRLEKQRLR